MLKQIPGISIYLYKMHIWTPCTLCMYNTHLLPETLQPALQRVHKQRHGCYTPRERRGRAEVVAVLRVVHEVPEDLALRGRRLAAGDDVRDLEVEGERFRRERGEGAPGVEFTLCTVVVSFASEDEERRGEERGGGGGGGGKIYICTCPEHVGWPLFPAAGYTVDVVGPRALGEESGREAVWELAVTDLLLVLQRIVL